MGRLSDAMGAIFLGYATLHHFERNRGSVAGLEALAESAMLQLEHEAEELERGHVAESADEEITVKPHGTEQHGVSFLASFYALR